MIPTPWTTRHEFEADVVYRRMDGAAWSMWASVPAAAVGEPRQVNVTAQPTLGPTATPGGPTAMPIPTQVVFQYQYEADISPHEPGAYELAFRMRRNPAPSNGTPSAWKYYAARGEIAFNADGSARSELSRFQVVTPVPTITPTTIYYTPTPSPTSTRGPAPTPAAPEWWLVRGAAGDDKAQPIREDSSAFMLTRFTRWDSDKLLQAKDSRSNNFTRPTGLRAQFVMWPQEAAEDWALVVDAGWWSNRPKLVAFVQRPALRMPKGKYWATYRMKHDWDQSWTYVTRRDAGLAPVVGPIDSDFEANSPILTVLAAKRRVAEVEIVPPSPSSFDLLPWRAVNCDAPNLPVDISVPSERFLPLRERLRSNGSLVDDVLQQAPSATPSPTTQTPLRVEVNASAYLCKNRTQSACAGDVNRDYIAYRTLFLWVPEAPPTRGPDEDGRYIAHLPFALRGMNMSDFESAPTAEPTQHAARTTRLDR